MIRPKKKIPREKYSASLSFALFHIILIKYIKYFQYSSLFEQRGCLQLQSLLFVFVLFPSNNETGMQHAVPIKFTGIQCPKCRSKRPMLFFFLQNEHWKKQKVVAWTWGTFTFSTPRVYYNLKNNKIKYTTSYGLFDWIVRRRPKRWGLGDESLIL